MISKTFQPDNKLVDIITESHNVILLLPRFNIPFGFGDATVRELCSKYNLDMELFLIICSIYSGNNDFAETYLTPDHLPSLLTYLYNSHKYYTLDCVPHIEAHLERLVKDVSQTHGTILLKFWNEYKKEILQHFKHEERSVFPVAQALIDSDEFAGSKPRRLIGKHNEIEDKLTDLTNIIIRYMPGSGSTITDRISIIFDLYQLTEDLSRHAFIENNLLMPFIESEGRPK